MSIIGPRPERPDIAKELKEAIPFYSQRHLIKPGVTGWDQVSGEYHSCSIEDTYKKLQYDLYYLKNMSFYLDFSIFFRTIVTVLKREGRSGCYILVSYKGQGFKKSLKQNTAQRFAIVRSTLPLGRIAIALLMCGGVLFFFARARCFAGKFCRIHYRGIKFLFYR